MIDEAGKVLLKCITKHDVDTFDELHFIVYHEKYLEFGIECFPPPSDNRRQHILRAYLQCYIQLQSAFLENIDLDPLEYGSRLTEDSNLVPIKSTKLSVPSIFPQQCNCQKAKNAANLLSANVDYWKSVAVSSVNVTEALGVRTL